VEKLSKHEIFCSSFSSFRLASISTFFFAFHEKYLSRFSFKIFVSCVLCFFAFAMKWVEMRARAAETARGKERMKIVSKSQTKLIKKLFVLLRVERK
jgi:hypothetical protein